MLLGQTSLEFQMEIVNRYLPLIEDIGVSARECQPFDLMIFHGKICDDPWFFQRTMEVRTEWEAAHPELSSAQKMLADTKYDFGRTAAQRMTDEEKLALRNRIGTP